jgi:hypothetical protein
MQIYLFVIDGRPSFRTELHHAQAVLEDHLLTKRDVSDVWWDDNCPYEARMYLYGSSHSDYGRDPEDPYKDLDFETTDQIIWPVTIPGSKIEAEQLDPDFLGGAELQFEVKTRVGRDTLVRTVPPDEWSNKNLRPHIISLFAMNAGQALADRWTSKESK